MHLSPLVSDQSNDHAVKVEEEHKQVEAKLDERLLLVHIKLPEDLRGVKQVLVLEDPVRWIVSACFIVRCRSVRCTIRRSKAALSNQVIRTSLRSKQGGAG